MELSPIVLFAYNRPQYLKQTLIALSKNAEASESDLYIYCDGPKENADEKTLSLIKEVRDLARTEQWCKNVFIIESDKNSGLSRSILKGVTEIVNKYGKVIVLEDDIVVAPYFLKFMNESLVKYQNEEKVASVSGYNFPVNQNKSTEQTFFLKAASCWGWATWDRAWKLYVSDGNQLLNQIVSSKKERGFNFDGTYPYLNMLRDTIKGKVDSWAIKWYASCFLNDKLTLYPSVSLVNNIGNIGTHINSDNTNFLGNSYYEGVINYLEQEIRESELARHSWKDHFNKYNRRKINYRNLLYAISKIKVKYKL